MEFKKEYFLRFLDHYWRKVLIGFTLFFLIGTLLLVFVWGGGEAKTFNDNIAVEFFVGGLMLMIPIVIGVWIGKRISKNVFYNDIDLFITRLKELRDMGHIDEFGTRDVVMKSCSIFGSDVLEDPLMKRLANSSDPIVYEEKKCGLCGLPAETINKHCRNCKLDCFAWEKFLTVHK